MAPEARATSLASIGGEQASQTAGAGEPKRRRRKKKGVEAEVMRYVPATGQMEVEATAKGSPSPALGATSTAASASSSASATLGQADTKPYFPIGTAVVLSGLAPRTNLEGKIGKVIAASSGAADRVAIHMPNGEKMLVKHQNLRASLFAASRT